MQIGTFIHRVLELTHATLLAEALGCDVADVDLAVESALLQDIPGSRITSDNLEHAKQVLDSCFAQVWDEQFNNINRASSNELIPHSIQERKQVGGRFVKRGLQRVGLDDVLLHDGAQGLKCGHFSPQ